MKRAPLFALSAIVVLGLGIAAEATIVSALDVAFFKPLPFRQPDQLVQLANVDIPYDMAGLNIPQARASVMDVARMPAFASVAAFAVGALDAEQSLARRRVRAAYVSRDFFATLGRHPRIGREFE